MDLEDAIEIPDDDENDNLEMEKRNVAALAESNMFPPKHTLHFGKRNDEDVEEDEGKPISLISERLESYSELRIFTPSIYFDKNSVKSILVPI